MAAYLIVEVETTDAELMAEYRKHTPGLIAKFGGKFVVRGGETETLEGGWTPPRLVMSAASVPTRLLAQPWNNAYAPIASGKGFRTRREAD